MKHNRALRFLLLTFGLVLAFLCQSAAAQYEDGSLLGSIHDASGAAVGNASITVTNVATGITVKLTTNAAGDYVVPSLRAGTYNVEAKAPGFAPSVAKNILIAVNGHQHIDLVLSVGQANTITVEVSDVALQLETESSERGQTISGYQTEALPLVSRNFSDLLGLVTGSRQAPSAATTSSISSLVRAGSYNVNGQRSMFNNFLLDGMDNNAYGESNQGFDNQIIAIAPDSVSQFNVVTNNESAEYGRSSGATVNVASASGTNKFHATAYEFLRNTELNAAGFFKPTIVGTSQTTSFKKPTLNRNQYGVNFGGPIHRDKLFYFVDWEGLRQTLTPLTVLTLPTQNELDGVLAVPVYNPLTGNVYEAGTAIPTGDINSLSKSIVSYFQKFSSQLPATGSSTTGLASNDYATEVPFTDKYDKGDLRLDYQQNANSSWFLRVSDRKETGVNKPSIPLPLDGQTNGTIRILDQQVALGYTHTIGANKELDVRLGVSRTKAGKWTLSIGQNDFTIPGLPTTASIAGGLPGIGITNFSSFGRQVTNPQWQNPSLIDPKINYSWVKGKHSLKFGYEYEHVWMAVNDNNPLYGSFTYGGAYSVCPKNTAGCTSTSAVADNYWADFLFGETSSYQLANYFVAHLRQTLDSAYAQDDWKVLPNLTLNLGLRWEYGSPYSEQKNNISNFDPETQTILTITPSATTDSTSRITKVTPGGTYGKTLVNPDYADFSPRVGFAWAVTPKIALRGGFGTGFIHYTRAGSGDILAINAPQAQFAAVNQNNLKPTTSNHCSSPLPSQIISVGSTTQSCYATADQGFPEGLVSTFNPATDNITWVPKNTRDSYVESWFLSLQRELSKNTLLDIAYVGNHGVKLQGFLNGNQKNPSNGFARPYGEWPSDITEALNEFYSNYNALQVRYEQRFVGGLTLLNSFTWEHALDNASASLEGNTPSPQDANNLKADYAQSDYNLPIANVTSLVYELPVGHGKRFLAGANGVVDTLLGGWQISAVNTAQAGTPFNITFSPNSAQALSPQISATYRGANEYRPYRVAGQKVTQGRSSRAANTGYVNYVNKNAFVLQPIKDAAGNVLSPFGTSSRNPGRTPVFNETDLTLNKRFATPLPNLKVEFRAEAYNLLNHTNLYLPGTISGTQGTTTSTASTGASLPIGEIVGGVPSSGGQVTSTFQPRILQFGLKILY